MSKNITLADIFMNRRCWVDHCDNFSYIKSRDKAPICSIHYQRQRRTGKPTQNLQGKKTKKMSYTDIAVELHKNNELLSKILKLLEKGKK